MNFEGGGKLRKNDTGCWDYVHLIDENSVDVILCPEKVVSHPTYHVKARTLRLTYNAQPSAEWRGFAVNVQCKYIVLRHHR